MTASSYMPPIGHKNGGSDFSKPPFLDVAILLPARRLFFFCRRAADCFIFLVEDL